LAKEKTQQLLSRLSGELDQDDNDVLSDTDSDVDPAWIPNNDDNDATKSSNSINSRHKKYLKEQSSNINHPPSTSSSINNNNNDNDHLDDSTLFKVKYIVSAILMVYNYLLCNYFWVVWYICGIKTSIV